MKRLVFLTYLIFLAGHPLSLAAEDLLDVETEMEDAFQDSEAAMLASKDASEREASKAQELVETEEKSKSAIAKAKAKKAEAIKEISRADSEIVSVNKKIAASEAKRAAAEAQYADSIAKAERKKEELLRQQQQLDATEKLLTEQQAKTAQAAEQARKTEDEILKLKDRMSKASQDFMKAKKDDLAIQQRKEKATQRLAQQKAAADQQITALAESIKTKKVKTLSAQEAYIRDLKTPAKARSPSSVSKARNLNLKTNCKAYLHPDSSGAPVWSGSKGQSISASLHNQSWARVSLFSGQTAYMPKGCF